MTNDVQAQSANGKPRGTIFIADYDFGDVDVERNIVEGAGFVLTAGQCKSEDEVIAQGRDADGVLTQYARVGAAAIAAFTRRRAKVYRSRTPQTTGARTRSPITPCRCGWPLRARSVSTIARRDRA